MIEDNNIAMDVAFIMLDFVSVWNGRPWVVARLWINVLILDSWPLSRLACYLIFILRWEYE